MKLTVGEHFPQEYHMSGMMVARSPKMVVYFPLFCGYFFWARSKKTAQMGDLGNCWGLGCLAGPIGIPVEILQNCKNINDYQGIIHFLELIGNHLN